MRALKWCGPFFFQPGVFGNGGGGAFPGEGDHRLFPMRALFPQSPDPASFTVSPAPSTCPQLPGFIVWEVKATALEAPWGAVSRSGLGRCWQASGVVLCACPGPRAPRRRPPQMLLPVPPPPCLKPLPTPGMSFAYHIPCLLPSEEGAPLHLSPPILSSPGPMEH